MISLLRGKTLSRRDETFRNRPCWVGGTSAPKDVYLTMPEEIARQVKAVYLRAA